MLLQEIWDRWKDSNKNIPKDVVIAFIREIRQYEREQVERELAPKAEVLGALTSARNSLLTAARRCDQWAVESQNGGWSTHQVDANLKLAHGLRLEADKATQVLEKEA